MTKQPTILELEQPKTSFVCEFKSIISILFNATNSVYEFLHSVCNSVIVLFILN